MRDVFCTITRALDLGIIDSPVQMSSSKYFPSLSVAGSYRLDQIAICSMLTSHAATLLPHIVAVPGSHLSIAAAFREWRLMRRCFGDAEPVVIANRYELRERIGGGGFGTVYEAFDRDLRRRVAVKVLELGDREEAKREGQALATVSHPNVVQIHDHGTGPDYRYYVLQLLEGPTLRDWCAGKSPEQIVSKYIEAARGLEAAHAAGLVHRDFKPTNVRIGAKGEAVVVDFGLARHLASVDTDSEERKVIVGTIAYAPPERLVGQLGDERSDQFSFCVALWEALAGVNPFGESKKAAERFEAMRRGPVGEPRGSKRVRQALLRGLSRSPGDRFPSVDSLICALLPRRRSRWADTVFGALVASVVGSVALWMMPPQRHSDGFLRAQLVEIDAAAAIVKAASGDAGAALQILESVQRRGVEGDEARRMAEAGQATARAFEEQGMREEAWNAWLLTVVLARASGDAALAEETSVEAQRYLGPSLKSPQRESM